MKKIVIAAAFVIAAFPAIALTEITLPDLKDCAYGVPMGTIGQFSLGMDIEKKNETDGLRVLFDGKECKLTTGHAEGMTVTTNIGLYFTQKRVTIEKAKEMTLRWVELVEKKYNIKTTPVIKVIDKRLVIEYTYCTIIKPAESRSLGESHSLSIYSTVDIDGFFNMNLNSHLSWWAINQ